MPTPISRRTERVFVTAFRWIATALVLFSLASQPAQAEGLQGTRVLVMSKTAGYRHAVIPAAQAAFLDIARQEGFTVTFTEDAAQFTDSGLAQYDAVVFLNTTGDILDPAQQASFERYIAAGRGLLGIHAATDTETDGGWPWYNALIGAKFKSHPAIQEARLIPSAPGSAEFRATDEWYDFIDTSPTRRPLVEIDRGSYEGSGASGREPIVWTNEVAGARAFYIGLGHTDESYASPVMRAFIVQGLRYAVGD
jgi:cytochrome c